MRTFASAHSRAMGKILNSMLIVILISGILSASCALTSCSKKEPDKTEPFVTHIFQAMFAREATKDEVELWSDNLKADRTNAAQMVRAILSCQEFADRNLSVEQKVDVIYQAMVNRPGDAEGRKYWTERLQSGVSPDALIHQLSTSSEFRSYCAGFEVTPGLVNVSQERDIAPDITMTVMHLYRTLLKRDADMTELNRYTGYLVRQELSMSELILRMTQSMEFTMQNQTDEEAADALISAIPGTRITKEDCRKYWSSGVSMDFIVKTMSAEEGFTSYCMQRGILPGEIKVDQLRDQNLELTAFLNRFYTRLLGKRPDGELLNNGVKEILEEKKSIPDMLSDVLDSPDSQASLESNDAFLSAVFDVVYGREPEEAEIEGYKIGLKNGITRGHVLKELMADPAFTEQLGKLGLAPEEESGAPDEPQKVIALTFDDGPYTPVTFRILDALKPYDAHATFFVVGNRVHNYSECIIRAVNQGCEIANHTWNHTTLTRLSADAIAQQMNDCDNTVYQLAGVHTKLMRPVGGSYSNKVSENVGRPMIIWSIDTNDWKYKDSDHVINEIMNNVRDGDIVLMHDLYETTATAVETVVPRLIEKGYKLVTVSELAEYKKQQLENGKAYFSIRNAS